jgi:large subunit ribosomal protein L2
MAIRQYKPTSAGRRAGQVLLDPDITPGAKAPKNLLVRQKKRGGRNHHGRITTRHRGGGHKQMYRIVDSYRKDKDGQDATILSIQYDPCRSARLALLQYPNGEKSFILAAEGMRAGQKIFTGAGSEPVVGTSMTLDKIPLGMTIHNIEMVPGGGAKMCRAAGAGAVLNAREKNWAQITLPSGEVRRVPVACKATIGRVGNIEHNMEQIGKAGRNRWKGIRPTTRGSAMNPCAHPMGGGEGRRNGGRHPVSPTGVLSKGGNTRNPRKPSKSAILRRRTTRRYGQKLL